jgi:predicted secreted protein
VPAGKDISASKLAKAAKSKNPTEAKEARLAETLGKLRKKKK